MSSFFIESQLGADRFAVHASCARFRFELTVSKPTCDFLITAAFSYLLGSIPFGYLLVRTFRGEDVRESGSGNIGATNVSQNFAIAWAL